MEGFTNTSSQISTTTTEKGIYLIDGFLTAEEGTVCPDCGKRMHAHDVYATTLRHIPFGGNLSALRFDRRRYECPSCGRKVMQQVPFQAAGHRITEQLRVFCRDLLAMGLTNREVSSVTGLGKNVVKAIDRERLREKYCGPDGKTWKKPEETPSVIGLDEFKLHHGHRYATVILSMETGHVLYLARGKKKQVVYDFIDFVGEEWMESVEAVCCDMNSDFQDAFEERCTHIQCVFDHFHIVKNFNDKVIAEVRKEEQKRLLTEKKVKEAASLKKSKFILTSSRSTLEKGKPGRLERYERLLKENRLLFTADLVKEKLSLAYSMKDEAENGRGGHRDHRPLQGDGKQALRLVRRSPGEPFRRHHRPCTLPCLFR